MCDGNVRSCVLCYMCDVSTGVEFETFTRQLADVDRCLCDGVDSGFVKITVKAGTNQIIGATICGPNAG